MFDLQLFDGTDTTVSGFGLLSAEDKAALSVSAFKSVSVKGANAYFYRRPNCLGEPDYVLRLIDGALPMFAITAPVGSNITVTNGTIVITSSMTDTYCQVEVPKYGTWSVSDGNVIQNFDVNAVQIYQVTFEGAA